MVRPASNSRPASVHSPRPIKRTSCDQVFQRYAMQILHGDESLSVMLTDLIDRADIGMVQGRSRLGLSLEAKQCLGISGYVIRQKFQRNKSVQGEVFGFVDDTHASAAEFLENAVMRDDLVDHEETSVLGVSRLASSSRTRRSRSTHSCTVYLTEKYRLSISPN